MALTTKRKAELAKMNLPSDQDLRQRALLFRQRSGLTLGEFSEAIGYGSSSLNVFLSASYDSNLTGDHDSSRNSLNIRAALKQYLDLQEDIQPAPQSHTLHPTKDLARVVESCLRALDHGSAYVIDGPPATQKTFSLREAERQIKLRNDGSRALYLYARINHAPTGFLRTLCNEAGVTNRGDTDQLILKLRHFLARGRTVLMVDEANNLPNETLDVLRQLLDLPPHFGVVLAGSDELSRRISHWKMERWHSRVRKTLYLAGPSQAEAREIMRAALGPLSNADCDATIAGCQAHASRTEVADDKPISQRFNYISARKLFWAIDRAREVVAQTPFTAAPAKENAA
jgi:DNA transposition AAA+ family ATPase